MPKPEVGWQEPSRNIWGLYNNALCLFNASPDTPGVNQNQREAVQVIKSWFEARPGSIALFGPMGSGKSTVAVLLAEALPDSVVIFKQELDLERFTGFRTQGGLAIDIARTYYGLADLQYQLADIPPEKIVVVDEFQFSNQAREAPGCIQSFVSRGQSEGRRLLFAGLATDFRREVWFNNPALMEVVEAKVVLAARCGNGCGQPAHFTMRLIDGQPAHYDDPVIEVGSVQENYLPTCIDCHQVLPPRGLE